MPYSDCLTALQPFGVNFMHPLYRKISHRLVPFLVLLYLVAFLDRVNVSFAALSMNRDLHISETLFGLAAGMFFLGYFFFEVPSNLMLLRIGARRWIMALMIAWGIVSVATAFVPGPALYIVFRFLLGSAEAGFYPGVILYLTFWLPPSVRSSVMAMFVTAIPLSNILGSPLSAKILSVNHFAGLEGWQWLFILEGSPAILLGALVFFLLPDSPGHVPWLAPEEKQFLARELSAAAPTSTAKAHSLLDAFTAQPAVYGWSFAYFCLMLGLYGLGFWVPTLLSARGLTLQKLGWATALPYVAAIVGMILWSRSSDRRRERRFHLTAAYLSAATGFVLAAFAPNAAIAITGFALSASGILSAMPVFWSASTLALAGPPLAAQIAVINSIGNLGGFIGPVAMGWLRQATHSYQSGLLAIAASLVLGALAAAQLCKAGASAT
jgi:ACS family tartrate transporter-like MFS transporter